MKQDPEEKKEEKKADGDEKKDEKKADGGNEKADPADQPDPAAVMEMRKNEYFYYQPANHQLYPPRYATEAAFAYPPAPQMFSDENPNACSVM